MRRSDIYLLIKLLPVILLASIFLPQNILAQTGKADSLQRSYDSARLQRLMNDSALLGDIRAANNDYKRQIDGIPALQSIIQHLQDSIVELKDTIGQYIKKYNRLNQDYAGTKGLRDRNAGLENQNKTLSSSLNDTTRLLDENKRLADSIAKANVTIARLVADSIRFGAVNVKLSGAKSALTDSLAEAKDDLANTRKQLADTLKYYALLNASCSTAKKENEDIKNIIISSLRNEVSEAVNNQQFDNDKEISDLMAQCTEYMQRVPSLPGMDSLSQVLTQFQAFSGAMSLAQAMLKNPFDKEKVKDAQGKLNSISAEKLTKGQVKIRKNVAALIDGYCAKNFSFCASVQNAWQAFKNNDSRDYVEQQLNVAKITAEDYPYLLSEIQKILTNYKAAGKIDSEVSQKFKSSPCQ